MLFIVPTPSDLQARFPAFASVPAATIARALTEAGNRVDQTWIPGDASLAIMLYAAHVLTLDGFGTGAEAAAASAGTLGFQSMRSGSLSLDRGAGASARDGSPLKETAYGRRFLALLAVNQPPVAVP